MDYHERILRTSMSADRRDRSTRALERMRREHEEETARLQRIEQATPPVLSFEGQLQRRVRDREADDELETVWDGTRGHDGQSLTASGLGSSLNPAGDFGMGVTRRSRRR
jgi:hypothetical protein